MLFYVGYINKAVLFTIFQIEVPILLSHLADKVKQEAADICVNGLLAKTVVDSI